VRATVTYVPAPRPKVFYEPLPDDGRATPAIDATAYHEPEVCPKCDGCGQVADTDDQEPWTAWTSLPLQSSAAVLMGLVKPIPCPVCRAAPPAGEER
jgi:hypothetical protein